MDNPVHLEARLERLRRPVGINDDEERYCICNGFDEGAMIACDGGCNDWFHLSCLGMKKIELEGIDKYICSSCVERGKGQTIYKPGVVIPVSSRNHYVKLPPSTDQAVSKQNEEDAKIARLLQKEGRSRRASKQPNEQRKMKAADKKEHATSPGVPSTSRVNPNSKAPLKPMRKKRRPQVRCSQGNAIPTSSLQGQPVPTPRQKPSSKLQGTPKEDTPPVIVHRNDRLSSDESSVDADLDDLQENEDRKAFELEDLEHTFSYNLVRRSLMEQLFGKTLDDIVGRIMEGSTEGLVEGTMEEAMQDMHQTTASWARSRLTNDKHY